MEKLAAPWRQSQMVPIEKFGETVVSWCLLDLKFPNQPVNPHPMSLFSLNTEKYCWKIHQIEHESHLCVTRQIFNYGISFALFWCGEP